MASEQSILQQLWIHAHKQGTITVPCGNQASATRMRFAMYNAVKSYRDGKGNPPQALRDALDNCCLSLTPDKCGIIVQPKVATGNMQAILAVLGDAQIKSAEMLLAEESVARIMGQLDAPKEPTPVNPIASHYGARG